MASNTVKKNVMLTLTLNEAKEIQLFMAEQPYISLARYIKTLLLKEVLCQRAKKDKKKANLDENEIL